MNGVVLLILTVGLGIIAWASTRMHALGFRRRVGTRASSLPHHYGWYVALWTAAPPLIFLAIWAATSPALVTDMVVHTPAAVQLPPPGFERAAILSEARSLAADRRMAPSMRCHERLPRL